MKIAEMYGPAKFGMSVEIFPPKTEKGDLALWETLQRLKAYAPAFVSCTYGAGGSTRDRTIEICSAIQERFGMTATAHFTCVGSSRTDLKAWLDRATAAGIGNIMALRGDAPTADGCFEPVADGLRYASELVALIRATHPEIGIGVAGYPEKHLEAPDAATDLRNLKTKVDAGASAVFTQLFYDNDSFRRFRSECDEAGISVPIIPGIMPITSYARIQRIVAMCGAVFPEPLSRQLEAVKDDEAAQFEVGVEYAIRQCRELINDGVPGIHFYVLNKSEACERILDELGLVPAHR